jgi:RimJ/RimL family protein N-acetyltransferase
VTILDTKRLILRHFSLDDAPFIYKLFNDPDWIRFIGNRNIHTVDDARDFIEKRLIPTYAQFGFGFYLTAIKETGEPVGMCGLIKRDYLDDVDIGYAFLPQARGKGFAFEAAEAVMRYGMDDLGLPRIVAITDAENGRSTHLLNKLGLHFQETITRPDSTTVNLFVPTIPSHA